MIDRDTQAAYDQIAAEFAARHAAMPEELDRAADELLRLVGPGARILDLGCGAGRDMALFEARGATVVGADLSLGMLAQARERTRGPRVQMDMCRLALATASFQGVWCCASLLHLPRRLAPAALGEMHRVLAPGGVLFLAVQEGSGEVWETHGYGQPVRRFFARYAQEEMAAMLERAGFRVLATAACPGRWQAWLHYLARTPGQGEA